MALQSSGSISMSDIETEYDDMGSLGNNLGSYYGKTRGMPTSGAISFDDFYGTNGAGYFTRGIWDTNTSYGAMFGEAGVLYDSSFYSTKDSDTTTVYGLYYNTVFDQVYLHLSGHRDNNNDTFFRLQVYNSSDTLIINETRSTYDVYNTSEPAAGVTQWGWNFGSSNPFSSSGTYRFALRSE